MSHRPACRLQLASLVLRRCLLLIVQTKHEHSLCIFFIFASVFICSFFDFHKNEPASNKKDKHKMSNPVFFNPSTGQANTSVPGMNDTSGPYSRATHASGQQQQQPYQQQQSYQPQQQQQQQYQQQPHQAQHGQPQGQQQFGGAPNAQQSASAVRVLVSPTICCVTLSTALFFRRVVGASRAPLSTQAHARTQLFFVSL